MIPQIFLYFSIPMLRAFFIGAILLANSCNQSDAEQVRKPNTSWQSTDQPPVYPGCEDRDSTSAQWSCFQASISRAVGVFFTDNPFPLNPNAPKAVVRVLDESGEVLAVDARKLLGIAKGDVVVVRGTASYLEPVNTVQIDAQGIFVR